VTRTDVEIVARAWARGLLIATLAACAFGATWSLWVHSEWSGHGAFLDWVQWWDTLWRSSAFCFVLSLACSFYLRGSSALSILAPFLNLVFSWITYVSGILGS
jgi:hypothetical protein